jgi:hypothetical protein
LKALSPIICAALLASSAAAASAAPIGRHMEECGGKLCPWFEATVVAPKGWRLDKAQTSTNRIAIFTPTQAIEKSLIYIKTTYDPAGQSLTDFVDTAQKRWLATDSLAGIEQLAEMKREGKPPILLYLYTNPSRPRQAFELTAFVKDMDPAQRDQYFFFQAVLLAPTKEAVEAAKSAFLELLRVL